MPEQEEALKANREKHKEEMKALTASLKEKKKALKELVNSPDSDRSSAEGIATEIKAIQDPGSFAKGAAMLLAELRRRGIPLEEPEVIDVQAEPV